MALQSVVDLCPPFTTSADGSMPDSTSAARLATAGARLPLRKHVHAPMPDGGDAERAAWRGCDAAPLGVERVRPEDSPFASPWDSLGGAAGGGGALGLRPAEMEYHGGEVMSGAGDAGGAAQAAAPVHLIWYGSWNASDAAMRLLPLAVDGASDSPWMRINAAYYSLPSVNNATVNATAGWARRYATAAMRVATPVVVAGYSYGKALSDEDVAAIVVDALDSGLPLSSDSIYVVLTSADVALTSGFCRDYCGWHASGELRGQLLRFAFVGDPSGCARPQACTPLSTASAPNGALGADAMASVLLHELAEARASGQACCLRRGLTRARDRRW
jgi:hypothetical protein